MKETYKATDTGWKGKIKGKIFALIVTLVLVAIIITLFIFGAQIGKLDKTDELSARNGYEKGLLSLDAGKEIRGTTAIRSKEYIPIDGLHVDLKDNAGITYQLFFYNSEKAFISASSEMAADFDNAQIPVEAEFARVMIKPTNDPEVSTSEIKDYAGELLVEWAKK